MISLQEFAFLFLTVVVGLIFGLLNVMLGPITITIVIGLIAAPWFVRDPFRLFIGLIIAWPVLTLYLRFGLPAGLPDITFDRVVILLTFSIILAQALALRKKLPKIGLPAGIYLAVQVTSFLAYTIFGGLAKPNASIFLSAVILPFLMYWMTKNLIVTEWHLKWLLYAFILASFIIALTGFYELAIGARQSPFPLSTGTASGERYLGVSGGRAAGVMGNPAIYGAVLSMGVLASLCCLVHEKRKTFQLVLISVTGVLLYGLLVSYTRSAWLAAILTLLAAQFFIRDLWKATLPIFVIGVLVVLLALAFAFDELTNDPIVRDRILEQSNLTGRVERGEFAWELFLEKPLFGWGPEALDELTAKRFPVGGFSTSHNTFLTLLVDGGLLLFLSFMAVVTSSVWWGTQIYRHSEKESLIRSTAAGMIGCMAIFLLSGLALELRFFAYFNSLFWISIGLIERLRSTYVRDEASFGMTGIKWL